MTKWLLHIGLSLALFLLLWKGGTWVSTALWEMGLPGLDTVFSVIFILLSIVASALLGGWLARRIIRWDQERGYL